jgi:hydrogenase nickel incorporation protein HypA/HybF
MHEYSVTESILSLAIDKAREAHAGKITRINLVLGELSGVVSDCVRQYFTIIAPDTIARDAVLSFETRPILLRCRKCDKEFSPADHRWACPACGEISVEIASGRECYLESIEVE